ncbi:MAG: hypothetical protein M3Z85_16875, partial [Acidobacteriota bacterium]|nr:hypothetical protein [Acidobacteriota bacterium]
MKCLAILLCATALSAADERIGRMIDPKLSAARRNDACFDLRDVRSGEVIRAMRDALSNEQVRACAGAR